MAKCNVRECKAVCCYNIWMDKKYISAFRKKIVTPIIKTMELEEERVLIFTDEDPIKNKCPFLTNEYRCNIYAMRPEVCRKFGVDINESKYLRCKYLGQQEVTTEEVINDIADKTARAIIGASEV